MIGVRKADPPSAVGGLKGINSEERMAHRIREVDESAGQYLKVQME